MKKITSILLLVLLAAGTLFAFSGPTLTVTGGYGFKQGFIYAKDAEKKVTPVEYIVSGPKADLTVFIPITYTGNFGIDVGAQALFGIMQSAKYFKGSTKTPLQPNVDGVVMARWQIGNEVVQFMPAVGLAAGYSKWYRELKGGFDFGLAAKLGLTVNFTPTVHLNFNIHDNLYFVDKGFKAFAEDDGYTFSYSLSNAFSANLGLGITF